MFYVCPIQSDTGSVPYLYPDRFWFVAWNLGAHFRQKIKGERGEAKLRRSFIQKKQGELKTIDVTDCVVLFQPLR